MSRVDPLRRLSRLRARLEVEIGELAVLRPMADASIELEELIADLDRQLARATDTGILVLVGSTGAGKSTLLNALAGSPIAMSGETRPTTRTPTVYAPRDADLTNLLAGLDVEPEVVRFDPDSGRRLGDQVLVDAPDTNSVAKEHRATVRQLAERADVLVVVEHRQSVVEDSTISFLGDFAGRRELVLVLNRSDELTTDARDELSEQLRRIAVERLEMEPAPTVHAISAAGAASRIEDENFERLLDDLEGFVREGRMASVRRHNALGVAASIATLAGEVREELAGRLTTLPEDARLAMEGLIGDVQAEIDRRLELRRAELAALLAAEAGRRWDGPGGWALRTGTWSTLGAGVGLALARRNPALAAGAALGGAAVGRARSEVGRRRLEDATTLLPESDQLARDYSAHLGSARVTAGAISVDPDLLDLPRRETLESELARSLEDAWSRLIHRRLPEAAENTAPVMLRMALDLPVYALAGWVLYRAADGFWTGEYVGLDFVINGLLLALAVAFLVRMLVRGLLSRRAGGLLNEVRADVESSLRADADRALLPLNARCRALSEGLDGMADLDAAWRTELERG